MSKTTGIYGLRCTDTNKWYIGKSKHIERRWSAYRALRCKHQIYILNALKKYGVKAFEFHIIEACPKETLGERETHWISHYNSFSNGYNLTSGGEWGYNFSEESRKRMSEAHIGQSSSRKGKRLNETTKQLIREAREKQAPISNEAREKLSKLGKQNVGPRNAMHGKMWITNGQQINQIIPKGSPVPVGWTRGRYISDGQRALIKAKRSLQVMKSRSKNLT